MLAETLLAIAVASCWGCGLVPRHFPRMRSPEPVARARAIEQSERGPSARVVPALVGHLEDPDPVVRLAAHEELRKRTGRDFGFVPWASGEDRAAAIGRWRSWLLGPPMPAGPAGASALPARSGAIAAMPATGPNPPVAP
jgi:hypothetical protein